MGKHNKKAPNKFSHKKHANGGVVKQKAQHQPKEVREAKAKFAPQKKGQQQKQKEQKSPVQVKGSPQVQKKTDLVQKKPGLTVQNGQSKVAKNFKPGKASNKTGKSVMFNPKPKNKKDQKKAKKVESSDEEEDEELDDLSGEDDFDDSDGLDGIEDIDELEGIEDDDEDELENDEDMEVSPKKSAKEEKLKPSGDAPKATKESTKEVKATKRTASEALDVSLTNCVAAADVDKAVMKEMKRRALDMENRSLFLLVPGNGRAVTNSQIRGLHPDIIAVERIGQPAFLRFLSTELRDKAYPALSKAHLNQKVVTVRYCGDKDEKKHSPLDKFEYFDIQKLIINDIPFNLKEEKIDVVFPKAVSVTFNDRRTRAYIQFANEVDAIEAFKKSKSLKFDGIPATVIFHGISARNKDNYLNKAQGDAKKSKAEAQAEKQGKNKKKAVEEMEVNEEDDDEDDDDEDSEDGEFEDEEEEEQSDDE